MFNSMVNQVRADILKSELINKIYRMETATVTYPTVDGSTFTLEIPVEFGADAVAFAQRSNEYQKAYDLNMHKWQEAGQFLMIVTTRYGTDICLFSLTTGPATATLLPISQEDFTLLREAGCQYLDSISNKDKYNKSNVVSFPLTSGNFKR